jgi:hypothetical protein
LYYSEKRGEKEALSDVAGLVSGKYLKKKKQLKE